MIEVDVNGNMLELPDTKEFEKKDSKYNIRLDFLLNPLSQEVIDLFKYQLDEPLPFLADELKDKIESILLINRIENISLNELSELFDSTRQTLFELYKKTFKEDDHDPTTV